MEHFYRLRVGIDWGTQAHQVCVFDQNRRVLGQRRVEHSGEAIAKLADWLIGLAGGDPGAIAVAIEVPRGPVVEALLERGIHIYAINPRQLDRLRDRRTMGGAKDDQRDAFVLGDSLFTDLACFRRVHLDDPDIIAIRELSRTHEEVGHEITRLANRLLDLLLRFYPQMLHLCPAADEPWFWSLLKLAPTPEKGRKLRRNSVEKLLTQHRVRKWTADQIRTQLKTPALQVAPGVVQAASAHALLFLPRLNLLAAQQKECTWQLEKLLAEVGSTNPEERKGEHRDIEILLSLSGVGSVIAGTMLAEASQPLAQRNYHALRTLSGVAPVTRQSGKRRTVQMRYGCNHRLRQALFHWARVSSQYDPNTREHYQALRRRGHSHPRALRGVGDRLLRILIAMLRNQTLYQPRSAPQLLTPDITAACA